MVEVQSWAPAQGGSSPWGRIDFVKVVAEGIVQVSTPGHGGYWLSPERNRAVPADARNEDGWYEEDSEWAIPCLVHWDAFARHWRSGGMSREDLEDLRGSADQTLRDWHPKAWEAIFGRTLSSEESRTLQRQAWIEAHRQDYLVTSAMGSWHDWVPKGWVMVVARRGGRHAPAGASSPERYFLVPEPRYRNCWEEYVVDLLRDVPWGPRDVVDERVLRLLAVPPEEDLRAFLAGLGVGERMRDLDLSDFESARREAVARMLGGRMETLLNEEGTVRAEYVARDGVTVVWPKADADAHPDLARIPHILSLEEYEARLASMAKDLDPVPEEGEMPEVDGSFGLEV